MREFKMMISVAARDLAQQKSVDELAKFDKGQLKHAETAEKNVLPGPDDIKAEQDHNKHVEGIEKFDKVRLLADKMRNSFHISTLLGNTY